MKKKQDKLHLLKGLKRILLDIDKAIQIIRETEEEAEVIPNLMIGFGIDQIQAEYVAEIKLRNINKEYILKRVNETAALQDEIADLEDTLNSPRRLKQDPGGRADGGGQEIRRAPPNLHRLQPRDREPMWRRLRWRTTPVHVFLSREGYFKKITPASLRMSGGPEVQGRATDCPRPLRPPTARRSCSSRTGARCTRPASSEFEDTKASVLGRLSARETAPWTAARM